MTMPAPTSSHRLPAARAERLIPAVIALLAVICVAVLSALVVAILPLEFSVTPWRFRSAALLLTTEPQLVLLLVMILVAAVYSGQHAAVRGASVALLVLAAALVITVPIFALDFLTQRHSQPQSALAAFTREGLRLGATTALLIPFMIWAGLRGWAASRPDPGAQRGVLGHGLVVGQSN